MSESIEGRRNDEATRGDILTAEHHAMLREESQQPGMLAFSLGALPADRGW